MKLLTLNTHSLEETDYESKLLAFAGGIWKEQPDIIALQEVNQTQTSSPVDLQTLKQCGYVPCMPCENGIRQDNHGFRQVTANMTKAWLFSAAFLSQTHISFTLRVSMTIPTGRQERSWGSLLTFPGAGNISTVYTWDGGMTVKSHSRISGQGSAKTSPALPAQGPGSWATLTPLPI